MNRYDPNRLFTLLKEGFPRHLSACQPAQTLGKAGKTTQYIGLWGTTLAVVTSLPPLLTGCGMPKLTQPPAQNNAPSPETTTNPETLVAKELSIISPKSNLEDGSAFIQITENRRQVIQLKAADVAGSTLLYRLQDGEDKNKFELDEKTGVLSFKTPPDWEKPKDADKNNNYMLLWQVVSSSGDAKSQFMVIQVSDAED